jgi:hypothetical protein
MIQKEVKRKKGTPSMTYRPPDVQAAIPMPRLNLKGLQLRQKVKNIFGLSGKT